MTDTQLQFDHHDLTLAGQLLSGSSTLGLWDLATAQLLCNLSLPAGLRSSASAASLAPAAAAAAAVVAEPPAAAGAEPPAADVDSDGDAVDGVLLHDGWLLEEDEEAEQGSDDSDGPGAGGAGGAAAAAAGSSGGYGRPYCSISSDRHLVAAGARRATAS